MRRRKRKVLFVLAHLDDEAFSSGTIRKMVDDGDTVSVLVICGAGAGENLDLERANIFNKNMEIMGATGSTFLYSDLDLAYLDYEHKESIKDAITRKLRTTEADTVFTNNVDDIHPDHRAVAKMVRTVCRPRSEAAEKVERLYECYIPGATEYGKGIDDFKVIVDISDTYPVRQECMLAYGDYLKGASSYNTAIKSSSYFGELYNFEYAEIFKLVWDRSI